MRMYHLLALATITPLSMEKVSLGKPAMFQALILIGSPSVLVSEKSWEQGIFNAYKITFTRIVKMLEKEDGLSLP